MANDSLIGMSLGFGPCTENCCALCAHVKCIYSVGALAIMCQELSNVDHANAHFLAWSCNIKPLEIPLADLLWSRELLSLASPLKPSLQNLTDHKTQSIILIFILHIWRSIMEDERCCLSLSQVQRGCECEWNEMIAMFVSSHDGYTSTSPLGSCQKDWLIPDKCRNLHENGKRSRKLPACAVMWFWLQESAFQNSKQFTFFLSRMWNMYMACKCEIYCICWRAHRRILYGLL